MNMRPSVPFLKSRQNLQNTKATFHVWKSVIFKSDAHANYNQKYKMSQNTSSLIKCWLVQWQSIRLPCRDPVFNSRCRYFFFTRLLSYSKLWFVIFVTKKSQNPRIPIQKSCNMPMFKSDHKIAKFTLWFVNSEVLKPFHNSFLMSTNQTMTC